jgi:hypothetical protein
MISALTSILARDWVAESITDVISDKGRLLADIFANVHDAWEKIKILAQNLIGRNGW